MKKKEKKSLAKEELLVKLEYAKQHLVVYTDGATRFNGQQEELRKAGVGVWFGPTDPLNVSEAFNQPPLTNQRAGAESSILMIQNYGPLSEPSTWC